eukprot:TRINITY_DN168_c0_g1_i2.p1 TRINITY_DN168_c0_g1~~TRINITY_DN168_c0_g1_i2.p1  ORF type:complete len:787 (-),score=74.75 TRINITY_DN168_c0_g1_i2:3322-5682(-)
MKANIEPYNEKHKNFVQSLSLTFGTLLKSLDNIDQEDKYMESAALILKLAYIIAWSFPGQLKRHIKRIKAVVVKAIIKGPIQLSDLGIKVLGKLCNCGTNVKEEAKLLVDDMVNSLKLFVAAQKPRTITDLVEVDPPVFHTFLLEDLLGKDKIQGKQTLDSDTHTANRRVQVFLEVIKRVLWHTSDTVVSVNLYNVLKVCFEILKSRHQSPDKTKEFIHGLSIPEYNLFLDLTKSEVLNFLTSCLQSYGTSLYSSLSFILKSMREAYILSENTSNSYLWQGMLQLLTTLIKTYGASCYDLVTEVLFIAEPNVFKALLADFRELIERYDKSVIKKGEKFFTSTEFRGTRKHKKKKLEPGTYTSSKAETETEEIEGNVEAVMKLLKEYVERCHIFIKKEHRATIEAVVINIMDLSYIHTFVEFPINTKRDVLNLVHSLIAFPGTIKPLALKERHQLVSAFMHFLQKAKECEHFPELRIDQYIVTIQQLTGEIPIVGVGRKTQEGEAISYKELVVAQNKKMLDTFLGNKTGSVGIQTEEIAKEEKKTEVIVEKERIPLEEANVLPQKEANFIGGDQEIMMRKGATEVVKETEQIETTPLPQPENKPEETKKELDIADIDEDNEEDSMEIPEIKFTQHFTPFRLQNGIGSHKVTLNNLAYKDNTCNIPDQIPFQTFKQYKTSKMIRTTFIARTSDGNILCETPPENIMDQGYMKAYHQAKSFLKTTATQPESRSVRFHENYFFQYFPGFLSLVATSLATGQLIWQFVIRITDSLSHSPIWNKSKRHSQQN